MKAGMLVVFLMFVLISVSLWAKHEVAPGQTAPAVPKEPPKAPEVGDYALGHREYEELVSVVKGWDSMSPELVETGLYGKTTEGKDCFYFRLFNEDKTSSHKVIVTACIHGNEPWSTSTVMAYAGWLLSEYGKNERMTAILDGTEVYFVPVVSPDSYPYSRRVDGVDPNRDFPTLRDPGKKSVPPVQNLRDLFLKIQPDSVLSGHTYGRVFLVPWGDTREENPNASEYKRIASEMASLAGYRWMKASQLYGTPIIGAEDDWYHRNGAFAMVMEFGSHQRKPSESDTESEFERTKEAFVFFLEESVKVEIKQSSG